MLQEINFIVEADILGNLRSSIRNVQMQNKADAIAAIERAQDASDTVSFELDRFISIHGKSMSAMNCAGRHSTIRPMLFDLANDPDQKSIEETIAAFSALMAPLRSEIERERFLVGDPSIA